MFLLFACATPKPEEAACADHAWYIDRDFDGAGSTAGVFVGCERPEGYVNHPDDCDDGDWTVYPGAEEDCGPVDRDCDGDPDRGAVDALPWPRDNDGDGWGGNGVAYGCTPPEGAVEAGGDCDDRDPAVNPDAVEVCDGADVDEDCNGLADDADLDADGNGPPGDHASWPDADGDGRGDVTAEPIYTCDPVEGRANDAEDCEDGDPTRPRVYYVDADRDFYGSPETSTWTCWQPRGFAGNARDCDDTRGDVNPDEDERCSNSVDDDCDREVDEADAVGCRDWYEDADGDTYGGASACLCSAADPYVEGRGGDCDDAEAGVNPDAEDVCGDGVDGDCDGYVGCLVEVDDTRILGVSAGERLGAVVAAGGDLDGDGTPDLVAARTEGYAGLAAWSGTVADDAKVADAFLRLEGTETHDELGAAFTVDVDLDGDGFHDLVVGAPGATLGRPGDVRLFLGPVTGDRTSTESDKRAFGEDGDAFGAALAAADGGTADVTGDGLADLAVGVPGASEAFAAGGAVVLLGGVNWPGSRLSADVALAGEAGDDRYGASVLLPGDLDGDGLGDLVAAAPGYDGFAADGGLVGVYAGPVSTGLGYADCAAMFGGGAGAGVGEVLAAPGDATGDGAPDLLLGLPGEGSAVLVAGPFTWGPTNASPFATIEGAEAAFGASVVGGDLDGNGVAEVIVGAPGSSLVAFGGGALVVLDVSAGGTFLPEDALAVLASTDRGAGLGSEMTPPSDLDGDGCVDLLLGSPSADQLADNGGALWLLPACALW